ncbi:hypothetical protein T10_1449 [Trichinella papuae]|uniref:Uncharacterized protein n=1 Tax=Trichinella papuae TaxID=268474 RepID=A0A0V1LWC4_9BILA|nr:hypothetical protein T10_1449 [Trichinella papuae]
MTNSPTMCQLYVDAALYEEMLGLAYNTTATKEKAYSSP